MDCINKVKTGGNEEVVNMPFGLFVMQPGERDMTLKTL
jgi:hypothetical protein